MSVHILVANNIPYAAWLIEGPKRFQHYSPCKPLSSVPPWFGSRQELPSPERSLKSCVGLTDTPALRDLEALQSRILGRLPCRGFRTGLGHHALQRFLDC